MAALVAAPILQSVRHILQAVTIAGDGFYALPIAAFGDVGIGRRFSASSRLAASVLFQANDTNMPSLGQYQWDFTIVVEMFYRVSQDTEVAELMLANAYPAVMDAFYNNRLLVDPATSLPTVRSSRVSGPGSNPWYESLASVEYRVQVLFLNCWMRNQFVTEQPVSN